MTKIQQKSRGSAHEPEIEGTGIDDSPGSERLLELLRSTAVEDVRRETLHNLWRSLALAKSGHEDVQKISPQQFAEHLLVRFERSLESSASEVQKLRDFLRELSAGSSLVDAAEMAGFTSRNTKLCPPSKKARIVLEEFLEREDAHKFYEEFDRFYPQAQRVSWKMEDAMRQKLEREPASSAALGRCFAMDSEDPDLIQFVRDTDTGVIYPLIGQKVPDRLRHQKALEHACELLDTGMLLINQAVAANRAGLVAKAHGKGERSHLQLVCLHPQTDSRIYGEFDQRTGVIVWKGIAKSHELWNKVVRDFK